MRCLGLFLVFHFTILFPVFAQQNTRIADVQKVFRQAAQLDQENRRTEALQYLNAQEAVVRAAAQDSLICQWYGEIAKLAYAQGRGEEAFSAQRLAVLYAQKAYREASPMKAFCLFQYASLQNVVAGQLDSSIYYYRQAYDTYVEADKPIDAADCWRNIGLIEAGKAQFQKALRAYERSAKELNAIPEDYLSDHPNERETYVRYLSWNLLNRADLHYRIDDFQQMRNLLNRSQDVLLAHQDEYPGLAREAQENQARLYTYLGDYEQAARVYKEVLSQIEAGTEPRYENRLWCKLAQVYGTADYNYPLAAFYWQKAIDHAAQFLPSARLVMVPVFREAARVQLNLGNLATAENFLQRARTYLQDKEPLQSAILYFNEARLYHLRGEHQQALAAVAAGMEAYDFPPSSSLANIYVLGSIIQYSLYKETKGQKHLAASEHWARQSLAVLEEYEDRTFQQRSYGQFYRKPTEWLLHCLFERYQQRADPLLLSEIFQLMEQNRGRSLRLGRAWQNAQQEKYYPQELLDEYRTLTDQRRQLLQTRYRLERQEDPAGQLLEVGERLVELDQGLNALQNQMYQIKPLAAPAQELSEVQAALSDKGSALLLFFAGDSTVFTLSLTATTADLTQRAWTADDKEAVQELSEQVAQSVSSPDSLGALLHLAFDNWLRPSLSKLAPKFDRLILVPDGLLSALPWAALCTTIPQGPDYRHWPYLLNDYSIRIIPYTGSMLRQDIRDDSFLVGCFAPQYGAEPGDAPSIAHSSSGLAELRREGFWPLPGAQKEAASIAAAYGSSGQLLERELTKEQFQTVAPRFSVLHLAMHAMTNAFDPSQSFLVFPSQEGQDTRLTALEALTSDWQTDLLVLSACYSGGGPWRSGEGVMSLAYAWQEAGIPSVVGNSWAVADQFSSSLMLAFHEKVQVGLPLDIALQRAQLDYIRSAQPILSAHPFYWAGFQLQGQASAVVGGKRLWWTWLMIPLAILLLALMVRRVKASQAAAR